MFFLDDPMRFADGKAVVSDVGMIPSEYSSGVQQRLGGLSKQGNPFCDFSGSRQPYTPYATIQSLQRFLPAQAGTEGIG